MFTVYLTDHEGNNEIELCDFETRNDAMCYILNSLDLSEVTQKLEINASNHNVVKLFDIYGLHYASYVIKEEN